MRVSPTPEAETHDESDAGWSAGPGLAVRLVEGAKAGLVATLTMTAYRLPVSRSLPPTARFWATFVAGGDPDDHPIPAVALHLLYGVAAGVGFGLLAPIDAWPTSNGDVRPTSNDPVRPTSNDRVRPTPDEDARTSADDGRETARRESVGLLAGTLYGLALSAFGERVVLTRLLGLDLDADERLVFHVSHLVYALTLGTWVGSRTGG